MRTSNILLYPSQFNQQGCPGNYIRSADSKRTQDNILPPLEYKNRSLLAGLSTSISSANQRQLNAAPILPNLKTVMESIAGENISMTNLNNNIPKINNSSPKTLNSNNSYINTNSICLPPPPSISTILNSNQYANSRYSSHHYPQHQQQFSLSSPIKFIIHRSTTIYQGDHVSIRGSDLKIYFAILMDFWLTENGKRYCTLRWLLPNPKASFTSALQNRFDLGPIHDRVEAMETILDVFYSPYRDQMTAEAIRKNFIFSPSVINGSEDTNSILGSQQSNEIATIDPPAQLVKVIKSLSGEESEAFNVTESERPLISQLSSSPSSYCNSNQDDQLDLSLSPSSRLYKSSSIDDVQMNPINTTECSEIAAKMLLSMN